MKAIVTVDIEIDGEFCCQNPKCQYLNDSNKEGYTVRSLKQVFICDLFDEGVRLEQKDNKPLRCQECVENA